MDFLIELLFDLVFEGMFEASNSSKIPKPLRIVLGIILLIFVLLIIGVIALTGILVLKENIGGIIFILLAIFLLIKLIYEFRKKYNDKKVK
jgi:NADH:ubiquinone oxidoreductase subunit 3 (subunit A)